MSDHFVEEPDRKRGKIHFLWILLPILIIAVGVFAAKYIISAKPKAKRKKPPEMAALVNVETVFATSEEIRLEAMGTVIPAREIVLMPQVSGKIIHINPDFRPGSTVTADTELLRIDPEDYTLAVTRMKSKVAQKQYELKLERGHQTVAKREWKLINKGGKVTPLEKELALRKPHLENARAALSAARAELESARLNLARTRVTAPFNAMIREKLADVGTYLTAQTRVATLVGTDEYWVQVSVPADRLSRIFVPGVNAEAGSEVRICSADADCNDPDGKTYRKGRVIRLLGELEKTGRMAQLLVSVEDPLDLKKESAERQPLLINNYVKTEIFGETLENVYRIPRFAVRDGNKVWLASPEKTLEIRTVGVLWGDETSLWVNDGLTDGDTVIVSDLATPVPGMKLRVGGGEAAHK